MASNGNGFDEWGGYMAAKISKLEEQFASSSSSFRQSNLFGGISIYVNGLTDPSADELKRIMMLHGGIYHHYERSHTTYIIAANLPDVKVRNMNTINKIISPQWVVDCVREQRLLDYSRYLLYTNQKTSQPSLKFTITKGKTEKSDNLTNSLITVQKVAKREQENVKMDLVGEEPKHQEHITNIFMDNKQQSGSIARTAVDPKFLSEFYNNSRLHHIASLGAGFKQYISELRENNPKMNFPERQRLLDQLIAQGVKVRSTNCSLNEPSIMHIDMDCFFVSVGLRKHPHLHGQPIAVTHSKGGVGAVNIPVRKGADRQTEMQLHAKHFEHNNVLLNKVRNGFDANTSLSEIACCSYEARAKGVHNGMFVGHAMKICPDLKTIPYDFEDYRQVAFTLYNTVAKYTLDIEAISCDEMFVDLSSILDDLKITANDFVSAIRREVREITDCPCSAGLGANKLQARMATKQAKPDGQFALPKADVDAYMSNIPIRELPGVGSSTAYTLKQANLITCGHLQSASLTHIQSLVGRKIGETLFAFCRGIDERPLVYDKVRKSISAEVNYGIRFQTDVEVETFMLQLCAEVHKRLCDIKRRSKCVTLKLMVRAKEAPTETAKFMGHGVCDNITKSVSLSEYTNDLTVITRTTLATMKALAVSPNELRGIGIQLSKLDETHAAISRQRKENPITKLFAKMVETDVDKKSKNSSSDITDLTSASVTRLNLTKTNRDKGKSNNVEHLDIKEMLRKVTESKKLISNKAFNSSALPSYIDPEVFENLPPEIQAELIEETKSQQGTDSISTSLTPPLGEQQNIGKNNNSKAMASLHQSSKVPDVTIFKSTDFGNQQQKVVQKCSDSLNPAMNISHNNIFMKNNCEDLLLNWIKNTDKTDCEISRLIQAHACELIRARSLDTLYDPLRFLHRLKNIRCEENSCQRHVTIDVFLDAVQQEMQQVYGHALYLGSMVKCEKCSRQ